jgi:hypothetical protein
MSTPSKTYASVVAPSAAAVPSAPSETSTASATLQASTAAGPKGPKGNKANKGNTAGPKPKGKPATKAATKDTKAATKDTKAATKAVKSLHGANVIPTAAASVAGAESHTILFHGNCVDGWFACYIAYSILRTKGSLSMYPIAPGQPNTWPSAAVLEGTHVLMVDVSVPEATRDHWMAHGALSIKCIDHHASAVEHWSACCPIHVESCAAIQTWQHFYPALPIPFWLQQIDRMDRWDHPTEDDRSIREILIHISHKPVQKRFDQAIQMTEDFLKKVSTQEGWSEIVEKGRAILEKKDAALRETLTAGRTVVISETELLAWHLPETWMGKLVYLMDNTNQPFDSTEASHLVFTHYPETDVFINYRKKSFRVGGRNIEPCYRERLAMDQQMIVYSARSQSLSLTEGTILRGHPTSAGASLLIGEAAFFPFLPVE